MNTYKFYLIGGDVLTINSYNLIGCRTDWNKGSRSMEDGSH